LFSLVALPGRCVSWVFTDMKRRGWGRLSEDGPGQNNPDPSEGPWGVVG